MAIPAQDRLSTNAEVCWQNSFNGKPQATVFYWLGDACGLPLNERTYQCVYVELTGGKDRQDLWKVFE